MTESSRQGGYLSIQSDFAKTEHLPSGVKCSQLCEFSLESLEIFFQVIKKVF